MAYQQMKSMMKSHKDIKVQPHVFENDHSDVHVAKTIEYREKGKGLVCKHAELISYKVHKD